MDNQPTSTIQATSPELARHISDIFRNVALKHPGGMKVVELAKEHPTLDKAMERLIMDKAIERQAMLHVRAIPTWVEIHIGTSTALELQKEMRTAKVWQYGRTHVYDDEEDGGFINVPISPTETSASLVRLSARELGFLRPYNRPYRVIQRAELCGLKPCSHEIAKRLRIALLQEEGEKLIVICEDWKAQDGRRYEALVLSAVQREEHVGFLGLKKTQGLRQELYWASSHFVHPDDQLVFVRPG